MKMNPTTCRSRVWLLSLGLSAVLLAGLHPVAASTYEPREGDMVFQSLPYGMLIDVIEGVSRSPLSHCGLVARKGQEWVVIEAIGSVSETRLDRWIQRGRDGVFSAYRLRKASPELKSRLVVAARSYLGRPYDSRYEMGDERIYCSELIYKAFKRATGEELGEPRQLRTLNWKPFEREIQVIEGGPVPLDRWIITPAALTEARQVQRVFSSDPNWHRPQPSEGARHSRVSRETEGLPERMAGSDWSA